ncbi:HNH endonuclease [Olivibacter oleidegradans]|uniref:HNH endonuclease n=1 Tax=Olivibacter oleidegradans TaxID=760123 RepID=UPI00366FE569
MKLKDLFMMNTSKNGKGSIKRKDVYFLKQKPNFNYLNSKYYKYKNYLLSVEWKEKRRLVLERDNSLCQHCMTATAENIHHLKYDNLFNEPLEDLLSLCKPCHEKEHQSPIA